MTTRRYGEDEVREIFSLATTGDPDDRSVPVESGGLSLDDLRRIAEEAGIDPARVVHAATSLDARGTAAPVRRMLGMRTGVSRVVELPRAPTDREWELLVAECRATFSAVGNATSSGGLRDWSNGNLHVGVEPTAHGTRLRLSTRNDLAEGLNVLALVAGALAVLMSAVVAAAGKPEKAVFFLGFFGGAAVATFGANVLRLPRWARERERQMAAIAEQAVALLAQPGVGPSPALESGERPREHPPANERD
jgi:hypothetical protein